jgi:hypothetical protein
MNYKLWLSIHQTLNFLPIVFTILFPKLCLSFADAYKNLDAHSRDEFGISHCVTRTKIERGDLDSVWFLHAREVGGSLRCCSNLGPHFPR